MSNHNGISGGQLMLAFLAGAVTGAAVALLASPQSGSEMRQSIKGQATRVPEALKGAYGRASRAAKNAFSRELDREVELSAEVEVSADMPRHEA